MSKTLYVVGFMFDPLGKKVVLIRKNRPNWQRGLYNGPGGRIEANETATEAIIREFQEETGVDTLPTDWKCSIHMISSKWEIWFFRAFSNLFADVKSMTDEQVNVFNTHTLPDVVSNMHWIIPFQLDNDIIDLPLVINHY